MLATESDVRLMGPEPDTIQVSRSIETSLMNFSTDIGTCLSGG